MTSTQNPPRPRPRQESAMSSQSSTAADRHRPAVDRAPRRYDRIVVKAGTSLLTGGADRLDPGVMTTLVGQVAALRGRGVQMLLVSSGAVAAGREALDLSGDGKDLPLRQALAAVGQGRLMHTYEQLFSANDVPVAQALLSRRDITDRLGYLNVRNTLAALLEHKVVPIINENDVVAVDELTGELFGDNDTLSALVANLVDADLLVMLGEIEGLFTADPHLDAGARLIPVVETMDEDLSSKGGPSWGNRGQGGMATKLEAARLATASGVDVVIASGLADDVLTRLVDGEPIGTFFPAAGTKMESRKRWMLSGLSTRGEIMVDDGAVRALRVSNRSLLAAGVTEVLGAFERGDIVAILDPQRAQMSCGIANYSSVELAQIKGLRSDRIAGVLGHRYGDEVVHRNNMVIL